METEGLFMCDVDGNGAVQINSTGKYNLDNSSQYC